MNDDDFMSKLPIWWAWLYTLGLPRDLKASRRDEIASDTWDQIRDEDGTSLVLMRRWLAGVPHDVLWRIEQGALARSTEPEYRGRWKTTLVGVLLILTVLSLGLSIGAFSYEGRYEFSPSNKLAPPGNGHIFGTDETGRDVLGRLSVALHYQLFATVLFGAPAIILGLLLLRMRSRILGRFAESRWLVAWTDRSPSTRYCVTAISSMVLVAGLGSVLANVGGFTGPSGILDNVSNVLGFQAAAIVGLTPWMVITLLLGENRPGAFVAAGVVGGACLFTLITILDYNGAPASLYYVDLGILLWRSIYFIPEVLGESTPIWMLWPVISTVSLAIGALLTGGYLIFRGTLDGLALLLAPILLIHAGFVLPSEIGAPPFPFPGLIIVSSSLIIVVVVALRAWTRSDVRLERT